MEYVLTITVLIILAIAVRTDLLAHRLPNALTLLGAAGGLLLQSLHAGAPGLLTSLLGLLAGAGVLLPLCLRRGMGAGDVKLMGAVGTFVGPQSALLAAGSALVLGAVFGLLFMASRLVSRKLRTSPVHAVLQEEPPQPLERIRKEKFPYALAIAGGTFVSLAYNGQLAALANLVRG